MFFGYFSVYVSIEIMLVIISVKGIYASQGLTIQSATVEEQSGS